MGDARVAGACSLTPHMAPGRPCAFEGQNGRLAIELIFPWSDSLTMSGPDASVFCLVLQCRQEKPMTTVDANAARIFEDARRMRDAALECMEAGDVRDAAEKAW